MSTQFEENHLFLAFCQ